MATSYSGTVEFEFPFLDPSLSSGFGRDANGILNESPRVGIQRTPWVVPFDSSIESMHTVFSRVDSQMHFARRDSTAFHPPSLAASISSFSQIPDFHVNPPSLPFQFRQKYAESFLYTKDNRGSASMPFTMTGASLLLNGKHGDIIGMTKLTPQELMDAKALAASKSHSEAERRRRERINTHLTTLRGLLPNTTKTDKASLLAEVIQHVKDLKRQVADVSEGGPIPSDVDELHVVTELSCSKDHVLIKASLCCDDRPGFLSDVMRALKNLKLQTVKAEIVALGGRVKHVIFLSSEDLVPGTKDKSLVTSVQESLRAVIERSGSSDSSLSAFGSNKRQRMGYQLFNPF